MANSTRVGFFIKFTPTTRRCQVVFLFWLDNATTECTSSGILAYAGIRAKELGSRLRRRRRRDRRIQEEHSATTLLNHSCQV
jgi:hypothetical protein